MLSILVVDDSTSLLGEMQKLLVTAGYDVVTAPSGEDALGLIRRRSFDVAITDIYMPAPDGLEVIREAAKIRPSLPFIAMSGKPADLNMLGVARALGAVATLNKPFSPERLISAIEAALDRGKAAPPASPSPSPTR